MKLNFLGEAFYQGKNRFGAFLFGGRALNELREFDIYVWGTGELAQRCVGFLSANGLSPAAFCDNNPEHWNRKFLGLPIIQPRKNMVSQKPFFILCVPQQHLWVVAKQVLARFGTDFAVFFLSAYGDFFDEPKLMEASVDAANVMLRNEIHYGHKTQWHQFIEESKPLGMPAELCYFTGFWDYTLNWLSKREYDPQNTRLLDIGPGWGFCSLILNKLFGAMDTTFVCYGTNNAGGGVEMTFLEHEDKRYEVKRIFGFIEDPSFSLPGRYDLILFTEVFEHLSCNPVPTLKKIADLLSPSGTLVFTTPTPAGDPTKIYDSWKEMPRFDDMPLDLYASDYVVPRNYIDPSKMHIYIYTKEELEEIFDLCGLEIIEYGVNASMRHNVLLRRV
jgi:SAM-dependent methyltransferase